MTANTLQWNITESKPRQRHTRERYVHLSTCEHLCTYKHLHAHTDIFTHMFLFCVDLQVESYNIKYTIS